MKVNSTGLSEVMSIDEFKNEPVSCELVYDGSMIPTFSLGNEVCSFSFTLDRVMDRKTWAKIFEMKKGDATEFIFPKKKKRHSMRINRRFGKVKCDICGKKIDMREKRTDGLPAGFGFELEDGSIVNVCTDCVLAEDFMGRIKNLEGAGDD